MHNAYITFAHIYMYIYICVCVYVYIYTHKNVYEYIYIEKSSRYLCLEGTGKGEISCSVILT
jgi:hypothetical protein